MMMASIIDAGLEKWIAKVRSEVDIPLRLQLWNGSAFNLGAFSEPKVTLHVKSARALPLLIAPDLNSLGEAYVTEKIDIEGSLPDIIDISFKLAETTASEPSRLGKLTAAVKKLGHSKEEDRASIQYHYDVSNEFYQRWLDKNMVYSCAYFEKGNESLDEAQIKKIDHILTKIRVQPGQTLLDIGCGWGALVIRAAHKFGAKCVGVTLSDAQFELATERIRQLGLQDQIEIRLQDYRDVTGTFDRITSVGMFEHVGRENLVSYFSKVNSLLTEDGVVMNHGITSSDAESADSPHGGGDFIDKYVFPQGELPHISLAMHAMQMGGLEVLDVENLRRHYNRTLQLWTERFEAAGSELRDMVGEQKYRIWRVYLAGCAYAFDVDNVSIYQVVSKKARQASSTIPWSRDFMYSQHKWQFGDDEWSGS